MGEQQQWQQSDLPSVTDTRGVAQIEARSVLNDTMTDIDRLGGHVDVSDFDKLIGILRNKTLFITISYFCHHNSVSATISHYFK